MTRSISTLLALFCPIAALAFDGGDGSAVSPYQISTCTQLDSIRNTADFNTKNFVLTADVDCSAFGPFDQLTGSYQGEFDGAGFAIDGLAISTNNSTAMFTEIHAAGFIHDLSLVDAVVTVPTNSSSTMGLLAGVVKGTVEDVYVSGTLSSSRPGQIGGLGGYLDGGTANRVHADVVVTTTGPTGYTVGGLFGLTNNAATLTIASASGDVTHNGTSGTFVWLGGLVGRMIRSTCTECSATGDVTATSGTTEVSAGGLVGRVQNSFPPSDLNDIYAQGDISVPAGATGTVGGLVGAMVNGDVTRGYASGSISGQTGASGLVGNITSTSSLTNVLSAPANPLPSNGFGMAPSFLPSTSVTNAVFNNHSNSLAPCSGSTEPQCVTSGASQSSFFSSATAPLDQWDFVTIWEEVPGRYPELQNSVAPPPAAVVCVVGAPFDWDNDLEDDGCRGTNVVIDPSVTVPAGTQMGNDVTVLAAASIGTGNILHNGVILAPQASLGDDNTLLANVVIGRGSTVANRNEIAADTTLGRKATIGNDNQFGGTVGYQASVGSNVAAPNLTLGNLASIGHATTTSGQINCSGPLVVGRGTQVAVNPAHDFTCTGQVVIGPDSTIESAHLGASIRIRKQATLIALTTIGDNARIGRGVQIGAGVTLDASTSIAATVELCDTSTAFSGAVSRTFVDPTCP